MKQFITTLCLLCLFTFSFAQETVIYKEIQKIRQSRVEFKNVTDAFCETDPNLALLDNFLSEENVIFFEYLPLDIKKIGQAIRLSIPYHNKVMVLALIEAPDYYNSYQVLTNKNTYLSLDKNIKHFRGILEDDPNSVAAITFLEGEVMGMISTDDGNYNIVFDKNSGKHIMYNDKNLKKRPDFICYTSDDLLKPYDPEILFNEETQVKSENSTKLVRFYIETEYDIYISKGSIAAVEGYITGLFNQVSTLYQNDGINTCISTINIWTTPDPYTGTTPSSLLSQFQNNTSSIDGDLGQLLTFRDISGGVAADIGSLCISDVDNKLSVTVIYNSYLNLPNYSWSVYATTHELGHLLGSYHTHACVWNGNSTAIDGCAGYTELGSCSVPPIPSNGGTIMSYCHLQSVGINLNLGFGEQPRNVIKNAINNASCLITLSGPSILCASNTSYSISNSPSGAMVSWSCSGNISYISGQGTTSCVFRAYTNGPGWIKVTFTTPTGSFDITKTVSVGLRATFSGSTTVLLNGTGTWTAYPTCGNEPYTYRWFLRKEGTGMAPTMVGDESTLTLWSLPVLKSLSPDTSQDDNEGGISGDPTKQPSTRTYFRLYLRVYDANTMFETPEQRITAYGDVDLISRHLKSGENVEGLANDIAGESMVYEQATGYDSPGLSLTLAPNPAGEWVDITVDGIDEYGAGYRVEFVNSMSRAVKTLRLDGSYNRISIGDMANGYYVVRIISGKNVASKILLVE